MNEDPEGRRRGRTRTRRPDSARRPARTRRPARPEQAEEPQEDLDRQDRVHDGYRGSARDPRPGSRRSTAADRAARFELPHELGGPAPAEWEEPERLTRRSGRDRHDDGDGAGVVAAFAAFGARHRRVLLAVGVVAAMALVSIGVVYLVGVLTAREGVSGSADVWTEGGVRAPEGYQAWPPSKIFKPIGDRRSDPKAMSVGEVFAEQTLRYEGQALKLAAKHAGKDCAAAVHGQRLVDEVAAAGCTQVLRGHYVSENKRYVAQFTLLNVRDAAAAEGLVTSLKTGYKSGWVVPLGTKGPAFPKGGYTEASGYAMGHYVALSWVGRADGASRTEKDDFVNLSLTVRGAEKAVFRRLVSVIGPSAKP
ncbi:hypothetical protein [Rhizohabitans arisaemae]|uniref:hypothetical protein n=1 Tax=Rhizohabitans arisaemae TaxID=2720610 RepID=UPI0024B0619A|nr:hypothetical protein [Rhizohabitans arisaemae]